jgi:hypothetical protein
MRRGIALLALVAGCSSLPKGHFDEQTRTMHAGKAVYRVGPLSPSWEVVHVEHASVGFFNQTVGGIIQANVTCRDDADAAPLQTLMRQLLIGYTDRRTMVQEQTRFLDRAALHSVVEARLDGVPMTLDLWVAKRNGCIFDLSFAAPPERFQKGAADFRCFREGFSDERHT